MPNITPTTDFFNSSVQIAFVYPEIGADRDIPYVYWNNWQWLQVQYDAFREEWSDPIPIFHGGFEAITRHFGLDPATTSIEDISPTPPETLIETSNSLPDSGVIYLKTVVQYCRWYNAKTKTDCIAEKFADTAWSLAVLNKQANHWTIEATLTNQEFYVTYLANLKNISFLSGLAPTLE